MTDHRHRVSQQHRHRATLVVTLTSSDTTQARVPATCYHLAGQASTTFTLDAVDDALLDGSQSVLITAVASGYITAQASIVVTDFEVLDLQIRNSKISEAGGARRRDDHAEQYGYGRCSRRRATNSATNETRCARDHHNSCGQSAVTFAVNAVDDALLDGSQFVAFGVSAAGYFGTTRTIEVNDSESLTLTLARTL